MTKFIKISITTVAVTIAALMLYGTMKAFLGNYAYNSPFNSIFIIVILFMFLYSLFIGIKRIWTLSIIVLLLLQSCNYAKSNQQVLVSDDCGMSWKKINAGDAVPKSGVNPCYMKVVIPNYPMQGDSKFISNLKGRVRVFVHIDYDYSITNGLSFIKEAKSLGRANSDADSGDAIEDNFEGAENRVIDKRIRDVAKGLFLEEDILEFDQAELEERLQYESNKCLEKLGVELNFITLTFELDDQTRQAIDVSTAMKIYESKNLSEVGKQVMIQRAGATKIIIESKNTGQSEKE